MAENSSIAKSRFRVVWIVLAAVAVLFAMLISIAAPRGERASTFVAGVILFGAAGAAAIGLVALFLWAAKSMGRATRGMQHWAAQKAAARAAAAAALKEKRRRELLAFYSQPLLPIAVEGIVLKPNESCYWRGAATLHRVHTHVEYSGSSMGLAVRVANGVYLRPSSYRGAPTSSSVMESDGEGQAYLTNVRALFVGRLLSVEIPFSKIVSTEPYRDGLRLDVANATPVIFMTGDDWMARICRRIQDNEFGPLAHVQLSEDAPS